jgi:hypothetical protein
MTTPSLGAGPGGKCVASAIPSPSSLPVLVFVNTLTCIITSKELVFGTAPSYGEESTKPTMAGYKNYTEKSQNVTEIIHPRATHPHNSILWLTSIGILSTVSLCSSALVPRHLSEHNTNLPRPPSRPVNKHTVGGLSAQK